MTTKQALIKRGKLGSGQEPSNRQRRTFIGGAAAAILTSPLLTFSERAMAKQKDVAEDFFILLLAGVYQPVLPGQGPNLRLSASGVNLNDNTYSVTRIYPVFGIANEGGVIDQDKAIGNFYAQFRSGQATGNLCAYQLPGGAIAMQFTSGGSTPHPDREGGFYLEGTFELTILEATGIYRDFQGGHNHMVDRLHQLADGQFDEFCFCNISTYPFP
jgi:hypothetical protein